MQRKVETALLDVDVSLMSSGVFHTSPIITCDKKYYVHSFPYSLKCDIPDPHISSCLSYFALSWFCNVFYHGFLFYDPL